MADTRKEQERDELHKAIWSIADDLRGSVPRRPILYLDGRKEYADA